jgi:hypothetical protein
MHPAVVVGLGQLGSIFAHGLLRAGTSVRPVNRGDSIESVARTVPDPSLVVVTVGEAELDGVLSTMPDSWRGSVVLVQNELLPVDWEKHGLDPTVAVVWFEKKKSIATNVILPTPVGGPNAEHVVRALGAIELPALVVDKAQLIQELVAKNVYILTMNLAGLAAPTGTKVGALYAGHRALVKGVLFDVLALQAARLGADIEADLQTTMLERAIAADPEHGARGRSAPARLKRALEQADALGVAVPALRALPV